MQKVVATNFDSNEEAQEWIDKNSGSKNFKDGRNLFKIQAFSKGGVIRKEDGNVLLPDGGELIPIQNMIANGNNTIGSAQDGERILTREQNINFEKLMSLTHEILETMKKNFTMPNISIPNYSALNNVQKRDVAPNIEIHNDSLITINGNVSNDNLKEMERIANKAVKKLENQIVMSYQRGTGRVLH